MQLMLYEETELEQLRREVKELRESANKVRRAMFARHSELAKMYIELKMEHEALMRAICRVQDMKMEKVV